MPRPSLAPPGARAPLVVLAVALATGAVMFVGVHRGTGPPPRAPHRLLLGPVSNAAAPELAAP